MSLALGGGQLAEMGVSIITDLMALGSQGTFPFVITHPPACTPPTPAHRWLTMASHSPMSELSSLSCGMRLPCARELRPDLLCRAQATLTFF